MTSALQGRRVRDPLQTTMVTQLSQASVNKNENKQISLTEKLVDKYRGSSITNYSGLLGSWPWFKKYQKN